ncbi:HAD family hydrolase [Acetobacter sicerae]|uniref:HAD family hydrolase n=1 Tax=Acetobacter sicerae TaxID=85325 RepID=UPI00156B0EC4|nr:HAD family phosphatase [Acetobacter sicerae]NHN91283.1 HAD-IA family hydrolase [Acetobacter sicerae]
MTSALASDGQLQLVIFDCDGVLIDSEGTSCRLIAEDARQAGWDITDAEAMTQFGGKALTLLKKEIEERTDTALPQDWPILMRDRFVESFTVSVDMIDGAREMLEKVAALGLPVRVGSNSSMLEMNAKFRTSGLAELLEGRIHSATDMHAPKPDPAVYLKAAEEEGVPPANCVVIEDSDTGAKAALAAGMACVLLRAEPAPIPVWPGLVRINALSELPVLLGNVLDEQNKADAS